MLQFNIINEMLLSVCLYLSMKKLNSYLNSRYSTFISLIMLLPYLQKGVIEAGCDEAGRGCLAGAVYAAAVILPEDFENEQLNDSKQLSERQRYALREVIQRDALAWAVGVVSPREIDEINILNASFLAMHRALDQLAVRPAHLLIDGNRRLHEEYPQYDWNKNKGYPTARHRAAIAQFGTTPYHRRTFNLLGDGQLSLDF